MTEMCFHPDKVLDWLTEISRTRALKDEETDIIEAIVCRGHKSTGQRFRWTVRLDLALKRASLSRGGIKRFAEKHGMSQQAAYDRLNKIRKGEG
jgi:hypothetical protein